MNSNAPATTAYSMEDQLKERAQRMKRKAAELSGADEIEPGPSKRQATLPETTSPIGNVPAGVARDRPEVTLSPVAALLHTLSHHGPKRPPLGFTFPDGCLRITRTPGRTSSRNTISLDELIDSSTLVSACVFAFFIAQDEFFDHLPFVKAVRDQIGFAIDGQRVSSSGRARDLPVYVGRDVNQDFFLGTALKQAGMQTSSKLSKGQLGVIKPILQKMYKEQYGPNFRAFYPYTTGCAHSKFLVLVYPEFLRIVVTSANFMDSDTVLGDNHWFIQDLPRLTKGHEIESNFEDTFLEHMLDLDCPSSYVEGSLRGRYDFSKVKAHLVTSVPGTHSQDNADLHGLLRLRRVVRSLKLGLSKKTTMLEFCSGSVGNLKSTWMNTFYQCAIGEKKPDLADEEAPVPPIKIIFPTLADVKACHEDSQPAACNIGCHLLPWPTAPTAIKRLFYHFTSKDTGRLFHMKLLMALNSENSTAVPRWIYIGSANFSSSAWGTILPDKRGKDGMKIKITNFECGVVIPGDILSKMLEDGTEWQDGVVPYVRPSKPYDLDAGEKAYNDPSWVVNKFSAE